MSGLAVAGILGFGLVLLLLPFAVGGLVWWLSGSWIAGLATVGVLMFGGAIVRAIAPERETAAMARPA